MRKILDYVILGHPSPALLEDDVKRRIRLGFEPYGEMVVVHKLEDGQPMFYQTVVEYEKN